MSKQRKPPQHASHKTGDGAARDAESAVDLRGNQALASGLSMAPGPRAAGDIEAVRAVAFPWLEQGSLALHLQPRDPGDMERLVGLVERSHFDAQRKDQLVTKLEGDQAAALSVQATLEATVGAIDEEQRSALIDALDRSWQILQESRVEDGQWVLDDGRLSLSERAFEGSAADRAGALIAELVQHVSVPGASALAEGSEGAQHVARFCRSVVLAYAFDEEEEEALFGAATGPEVEG